MKLKNIIYSLSFLFVALFTVSCDKVDSQRIPPFNIYLDLGNAGLWNTYGVHGYGQFKYFNREQKIPANYSFKINDFTGFGGILLIHGINGPIAYDRACPFEVKKDVVVKIDTDNYEAYCPKCGSRFNVCDANGAPIYGPALDRGYSMRRANVIPQNGGYIVVR